MLPRFSASEMGRGEEGNGPGECGVTAWLSIAGWRRRHINTSPITMGHSPLESPASTMLSADKHLPFRFRVSVVHDCKAYDFIYIKKHFHGSEVFNTRGVVTTAQHPPDMPLVQRQSGKVTRIRVRSPGALNHAERQETSSWSATTYVESQTAGSQSGAGSQAEARGSESGQATVDGAWETPRSSSSSPDSASADSLA